MAFKIFTDVTHKYNNRTKEFKKLFAELQSMPIEESYAEQK